MHYCIIIGASLSEPHIDELNVRNLYIIIIIIIIIIGASLSEPHIDELNVRNLYIIIIIIIIIIIMVRTSPARRCRDCTGVRDIFQHDLAAA